MDANISEYVSDCIINSKFNRNIVEHSQGASFFIFFSITDFYLFSFLINNVAFLCFLSNKRINDSGNIY